MIGTIKSEFQKIFTVRSTYIIIFLSFLLCAFFAFYAEGFDAKETVNDPNKLANVATEAIGVVSTICALVGLLLVTHEYRYNTIMYTLTASRSRTKVLVSKIIAVSVFSLIFCSVFAFLAPALTYLGIQFKGLELVTQDLSIWSLLWRALLAGWAMSMFALIIAFIIRSQVGAIIVFLFVIGTVEQLLSLLLKSNTVYLPFMATNSVLSENSQFTPISYGRAAIVVCLYVVIGWVISWQLFKRRDAN